MATVKGALQHAWDVFTYRPEMVRQSSPTSGGTFSSGFGAAQPGRSRMNTGGERTIISSIYTRISIDVASINIRHVRMNKAGRYQEDMVSELQERMSIQPNKDQGPDQFMIDVIRTLFDKGVAVLVPIDTNTSPWLSNAVDILSMRVGYVVGWEPDRVRVNVYNDRTGNREEITMLKSAVAIIENPLYDVINEPNSTLQRLIRKLNLLDVVDDASASGKLDLIIQLPYTVRSETKRQQAEQRRKDLEFQLANSKYGIGYTDSTEKITQLNRPVDNQLMGQIEFLVKLLYSQLGLTPEMIDGTADEKTMLNYMNRTLKPLLRAITQAMTRSFLTKTARTQGQGIMFFSDPFALVPLANIAEIADKFTRNEIASSNEIRGVIGWAPSSDPKADQLRNANMPVGAVPGDVAPVDPAADPNTVDGTATEVPPSPEELMGGSFDEISNALDTAMTDLGIDDTAGGSGNAAPA
jgi:Phage portal protein